MKILHLIDSGGLYGAEVMLINLAVEQQKLGLGVVIGSIRKPELEVKPLEQEARIREISVQTFEMKPGPNLFGAWRILRFARRNGFDLIHSHGYKTNILLGFLPRIMRRVPFVSTLHGWTTTGTWTKMRVNEILDSIALRFVDRIALVNKGMLINPKIQKLPQSKVCIIDNGIEVSVADNSVNDCVYSEKSLENKIKKFGGQGVVVGSIGRLSVEKGYSHLIEAVAKIRKNHLPNIRLLLIGDGRLRLQLQKEAEEAGIEDSFLITGYVKNARNLLELIDIYAISSLTEGLPITLLETMASGTPIVATSVGGIPQVLESGKDALLVPAEDSMAIAQAVVELIRNSALGHRLATNALNKVRDYYSSRIMAEKYCALYGEVLKSVDK